MFGDSFIAKEAKKYVEERYYETRIIIEFIVGSLALRVYRRRWID